MIWSTEDELRVLRFIASELPRDPKKLVPSVSDRKARLQTWLDYSLIREWGKGLSVDKCRSKAKDLINSL